MSNIHEKIKRAIDNRRMLGELLDCHGYDHDRHIAVAIAEEMAAQKEVMEAKVQRQEAANFHLASWQCPFTGGNKGLVNAENGDQYCAMERKVQRLEAMVRFLEDLLIERGAMEDAPCFICGYDGPGYYQPDKHRCAARHHKLWKGDE